MATANLELESAVQEARILSQQVSQKIERLPSWRRRTKWRDGGVRIEWLREGTGVRKGVAERVREWCREGGVR